MSERTGSGSVSARITEALERDDTPEGEEHPEEPVEHPWRTAHEARVLRAFKAFLKELGEDEKP